MKTFLTLFVLFFSSSVVANSGTIYPYIFDVKDSSKYPFKGNNALEKKRSEVAGRDSKWLTWCDDEAKENAIWTKEQVKKLSKPDYKLFMKEYRKQPKGAWCGSDTTFMKRNSKYIRDLQAKVDLEFGLIKRPPYYCKKNAPNETQPVYKKGKLSSNPCGDNKQITKDEYAKLIEDFEEKKKREAKEKRLAEEKRIEELKKLAEKEKLEEEKKKQESAEYIAEQKRLAEEKKASDEKRVAEEKRLAEEKRISEEKAAEEKRISEEKAAEEKRLAEEKQIAEEKRIAEEKYKKQLALLPSDSDLQKAKNFINDVIKFYENNQNEFDVFEIATFLNSTKPILEGTLDDIQKENLKLLTEYVLKSDNFINFEKEQSTLRINLGLAKIEESIRLLEENIKNLTNYLRDNITSNYAGLLTEEIKSAQSILNDPKSLFEIEKTNTKLVELQFSLAKLSEEIQIAENYILKLKLYLQENITSELGPEIIEKVELLEKNLNDYNQLIKINRNTEKFIKKNNLKTEEDIVAEKKVEEKRIADDKRKKELEKNEKERAKEEKRLKDFKTVYMTCTHDIYKQYDDSYDWWYDGKKIGWKEYSFKVNGSTFVDDGLAQVTFSVSKLSGLDNFKITMNMSSVFGKMTYVYETNFYNKESVLFFEGRRYRGICY